MHWKLTFPKTCPIIKRLFSKYSKIFFEIFRPGFLEGFSVARYSAYIRCGDAKIKKF